MTIYIALKTCKFPCLRTGNEGIAHIELREDCSVLLNVMPTNSMP